VRREACNTELLGCFVFLRRDGGGSREGWIVGMALADTEDWRFARMVNMCVTIECMLLLRRFSTSVAKPAIRVARCLRSRVCMMGGFHGGADCSDRS